MAPRRASAGGAATAAAAAAGGGGGGAGGGADHLAYRHCFLQAVMAQQYMKESAAKELFRQITGAAHDANYMHFVGEINQQLNFAQFELRRAKYPVDGEFYLGFVNREGDEASKRSVKYRGSKDGKPDTRVTAYFRALLDHLAAAQGSQGQGPGHLTSQQALYLEVAPAAATQAGEEEAEAVRQQAQEVAKLNMRERELVLAQLTTDGWLAHLPGRAGCYSLGPRSFLELSQALEGMAQ